MFPHGRSLVKKLSGKPFAMIGVNSDPVDVARKAVRDNQLNWRSFQDAAGTTKISDDWLVRGWPTLVVLDAEHRIHFRGGDPDEAESVIQSLLEKMAK